MTLEAESVNFTMRIIGGKAKGRRVSHDKSGDLRPTSALVRESLYNIIRTRILGARFLDLFAGTGAVGLEALSRGASSVTFVDNDKTRVERIRRAVGDFGFGDRATVVCAEALRYLGNAEGREQFDLVFADPPYGYVRFEELFEMFYNSDVIAGGGLLIIEHSARKLLPRPGEGYEFMRDYKYGDSRITLFRRDDAKRGDMPRDI